MKFDKNKESDIDELEDANENKKKKSKCLAICLITLIVMMLPSTLAFLAIF